LAFGADAKQVADEQRLEHQRRIERRAPVVRAIKSGNPIVDKGKIDHRIDLAKQVIVRNQTVETNHLQSGLLRRGLLQHAILNQKPPAKARGLSAVWGRLLAAFWFLYFGRRRSRRPGEWFGVHPKRDFAGALLLRALGDHVAGKS